jgi:ribosome-associated toxin RatA of RatAB toxin-antitoxin module
MRRLAALAALGLCLSLVHPLPVVAQTADQNRRIANGETVTWVEDSGQPLKTCVAIGIIDVPPEKVYRAMTDFANYPQVFRVLRTSKIVRQSGNDVDVAYTMQPPWPLTERRLTNRTTLNPGGRAISYRLLEGNVKVYEGQMIAAPWGKNKTRFSYRTRIDPGIPLLPAWAITWGTRTSLPGVVRDLGNYARNLP